MFSIEQAEHTRERATELQPGFYRVAITDVELKKTKNGTGDYFEFVLQVVAPEGVTSKIWHRINFNNPSEKVVIIGRAQLADFIYACKCKGFESVEQLRSATVGHEVLVEVSLVIEADRQRNEVDGVWSITGHHRNGARNMKEIKLGANGKKPFVKSTHIAAKPATSALADFPF